MQKYIVRRLLLTIPTFFLATLVIFALMRVIPGDIATAILYAEGGESMVTPEDVEKFREQLGLTRPLPIQYLDWLGDTVRGDLGYSQWMQQDVRSILTRKLYLSMELTILALIVGLSLAIPIGVISALRQDTWVDYVLRIVSVGGLAMPTFWVGILIILILVGTVQWMPPLRYYDPFDDPWQNLQMMVFPALALGYRFTAVTSRMTRSLMLEVIREDYIRTAWAKGLRESVVVYRHTLKNAILPVVTLSGVALIELLSGAIVLEQVFALPGLGRVLLQSIYFRDYITIQAVVLILAVVVMIINLVIDLTYAVLDPRIRYA